jgi:geranylgeranyl diphosphate synthase type I
MIGEIKNKIEKSLFQYIKDLDKRYSLTAISPVLAGAMKDFLSRPGKRIRPMFFVLGFKAFSKKQAKGLYTSCLSIELLHDFMLVHDDIIDKSRLRRGRPSMHELFNIFLKGKGNIKFSGEDLSIVAGDMIYAMALDAFLEVDVRPEFKEEALKKLIRAVFLTGCGEFIELLSGIKDIGGISEKEIYKIYDYKTAYYTFAAPLSIGATLAGAPSAEREKLLRYGLFLGRAFQIQDDILGIFGNEAKIGKSTLTDLQEAKKTILIRQAYKSSSANKRAAIKKVLSKSKVNMSDLSKIKEIVVSSGSLDYAEKEISNLINKSDKIIDSLHIKKTFKHLLKTFSHKTLGDVPH